MDEGRSLAWRTAEKRNQHAVTSSSKGNVSKRVPPLLWGLSTALCSRQFQLRVVSDTASGSSSTVLESQSQATLACGTGRRRPRSLCSSDGGCACACARLYVSEKERAHNPRGEGRTDAAVSTRLAAISTIDTDTAFLRTKHVATQANSASLINRGPSQLTQAGKTTPKHKRRSHLSNTPPTTADTRIRPLFHL